MVVQKKLLRCSFSNLLHKSGDSRPEDLHVAHSCSVDTTFHFWKRVLTLSLIFKVLFIHCTLPPSLPPSPPPSLPPSHSQWPGQNTTNTSDACVPYTGEFCKAELTSMQHCLSDRPSPVLTIPSTTDQQQGETDITLLLRGLPLLRPSPECERSLRPFLCLHVFGVCDSESDYHFTNREMCSELRDEVCVREWSVTVELLGEGVLPVCENLTTTADDDCTAGII